MIIFDMKTKLEINYRLPHEFNWRGSTWIRAISVWVIYFWNEDYPYLFSEYGYRFLGIEVIFTK